MGKGPHSPGARAGAKERRYLGTTRSHKVERRAVRILELWAGRPGLRPEELKAMIRKEFECGIGASEQALKRAYEIYDEQRDDASLVGRLAAQYLELAEGAKRDKDWNAARKILDSLRAHLGIGAPERVELSGNVGVGPSADEEMSDLSDEQLALLERMDASEHAKVH